MSWKTVLKEYKLEEFIIKASKKASKKGQKDVAVGRDKVTVITTGSLKKVTDDLNDWYTTCSNLRGSAIGITGEKSDSLLDHVMNHVTAQVQRPGASPKEGAMETIDDVMKIAQSEHAYEQQELKKVDGFIQDLKGVEDDDETNPQNIPFTVPDVVGAKGAETTKEVHGHYRTPEYVKDRKIKNRSVGPKAVSDDWYNENTGQAKPPFWQALFARGDGGLVKWGILPLLEKFSEEMEEQELEALHVKGRFQREDIEKLPTFIKTLGNLLKEQTVYRDPTGSKFFTRLHLNFAALKRLLQKQEFELKPGSGESDFVKKVTGHDELVGELQSFFIDNISITLLRRIIGNNFKLDTYPHGNMKGIFLKDPIRVKDERKKLYNRELAAAKKADSVPGWAKINKSWGSMLMKASWQERAYDIVKEHHEDDIVFWTDEGTSILVALSDAMTNQCRDKLEKNRLEVRTILRSDEGSTYRISQRGGVGYEEPDEDYSQTYPPMSPARISPHPKEPMPDYLQRRPLI
jgi:hypothetical protein